MYITFDCTKKISLFLEHIKQTSFEDAQEKNDDKYVNNIRNIAGRPLIYIYHVCYRFLDLVDLLIYLLEMFIHFL